MRYSNKIKYHLFFACTAILFFFIDLSQFFLLGSTIIPCILCMYCSIIFYNTPWTLVGIIALVQCLESFCFYALFFLPLIYIIPATAIASLFKKNLYPSLMHICAITLLCSLIQIYATDGLLLHMWPINSYTIIRITGTLLIVIGFSLTINIWGMQDNRA